MKKKQTLEVKLRKVIKKYSKKFPSLQVLIKSDLLEDPLSFSSSVPNQQFHSASVGKMMTAIVIVQAIEKGLINWDTLVKNVLDDGYLDGLFILNGKDFQEQVTINHLLGHTSGVNDYFEGDSDMNPSLLDEVCLFPDKFYTPDDLINITKKHQESVSLPDEGFLYSDTGYVLLGLIAEKLYKKPFYQVLRDQIFNPLKMQDTGLCFYDENFDQDKLAPIYLNKTNLQSYKSLSVDFSGGGLFTTTNDLSIFLIALRDNKLITKASLDKMSVFNNHFNAGIFYGKGLMELRFEKFFFLLKGLPRLKGHLGILSVHAWFDPLSNDIFVINGSDSSKMITSFRLLIQCVQLIAKQRN